MKMSRAAAIALAALVPACGGDSSTTPTEPVRTQIGGGTFNVEGTVTAEANGYPVDVATGPFNLGAGGTLEINADWTSADNNIDIVLYLGVLYHTHNPFYSLGKVAALTDEQLIVETLGVHLPGQEGTALWEFFNSDQVNTDKSTWWAPNEAGLADMLRACGFNRVDIKSGAGRFDESQRESRQLMRIWAHAWK